MPPVAEYVARIVKESISNKEKPVEEPKPEPVQEKKQESTKTTASKKKDDDDVFSFDEEDDDFDDDDLDVAGDDWGTGDEELDELDVFDADDDDFEDGFSSGTSHAEFTAGSPQQMVVAAQPAEWGVGTFLGVLTSTTLLAVCATVMYDLLRTMWAWDQPTESNAYILDLLRDMF